MKKIQEIYCEELQSLKTLRCKVAGYETKMGELATEEKDLIAELDEKKEKRAENAETLSKLKKELSEQKLKMERANRDIQNLLKEIKQKGISDEYLELFQRDLSLQELELRNRKALNLLTDMASSDADGPKIIRFMLDKGLKMPTQLKPARSCISSKSNSVTSLDVCSSRGTASIIYLYLYI